MFTKIHNDLPQGIQPSSSTTTQISASIKLITQKTKGEGDCAFHAVMGDWNPAEQRFVLTDVQKYRRVIADRIRALKEDTDSRLFELVQEGIQDIVIKNHNIKGNALKKLLVEYQQHQTIANSAITAAWNTFVTEIEHYPDVLKSLEQFIQLYIKHRNNLSQEILKRLQSELPLQFSTYVNADAIYFKQQSEGFTSWKQWAEKYPHLDEASKRYLSCTKDFDWAKAVNNPEILSEYADFIETLGRCLLPCELGIIAYCFEIRVDYYATFHSEPSCLNPEGQKGSVAVCFDGDNHYERMMPSTWVQPTPPSPGSALTFSGLNFFQAVLPSQSYVSEISSTASLSTNNRSSSLIHIPPTTQTTDVISFNTTSSTNLPNISTLSLTANATPIKTQQYKFGSPNAVPEPMLVENLDDKAQLKHGSHGVQGGERGNDYQSIWMALACLNAVYTAPYAPQLAEIILEGFREPFDDIELRKSNGHFTLFQSKHRDKSSSDNILISELLALPSSGEKDKKNDKTAFSLAKYFKGMMKQLTAGLSVDKTNFIICASASFAVRFKKINGDKKQITLEENTWKNDGVLADLPPEKIDPLFSSLHLNNTEVIKIGEFLEKRCPTKLQPRYVRFSDKFIENKGLTENQLILRESIFNVIKIFIQTESNAKDTWVTQDISDRQDYYIGLFLKNLQLWIDQPKLENLEAVLRHALHKNFMTSSVEIYQDFYMAIKATSDRGTKSLGLKDITQHLRRARGGVLAKTIRIRSHDYKEKHLLDFMEITPSNLRVGQSINAFIDNNEKKILLLHSPHETEEMKYLVFCILNASHNNPEKWCIISADIKPVFHDHVIVGEVDHVIEDLFQARMYDVMVIDNAESLLKTTQGRNQLKTIAKQKETKLILICPDNAIDQMKGCMGLEIEEIGIKSFRLDQDSLLGTIVTISKEKKRSVLLKNKAFAINGDLLTTMPSLSATLTRPSILANFINHSMKAEVICEVVTTVSPVKIQKYHPINLKSATPYYNILDMLQKVLPFQYIEIKEKFTNEELVKALESSGHKISQSKAGNILITLSENAENFLLILNYCPELGQYNVTIDGIQKSPSLKKENINQIPWLIADGFLTSTATETEQAIREKTVHSELLKPAPATRRVLLVADYGAGKSSLLKQLFESWRASVPTTDSYEWIIPCELTQLVECVRQSKKLIDIIVYQLSQKALIDIPVQPWVLSSLEKAIVDGRVLLLLDRWDELYETQFVLMNTWLKSLPPSINCIVASRPYAIEQLPLKFFHHRIEPSLFNWQDIQAYIEDYFSKINANMSFHHEFIENCLAWLGGGEKYVINELLARPLHLNLLCTSLERYYQFFCLSSAEQNNNLSQLEAPWKENEFSRVKLYQRILYEQFRKYIVEQVQASPIAQASEEKGIYLFTQAHQIRLREIGFKLIFDQEPFRLITVLDEKMLLSELYHLGILNAATTTNNKVEFVYQTFAEYFAAQYLFSMLLRGEDDFLFKDILTVIQGHASNSRFEQVWRILGEMIRYGDPALNHFGIGKNNDVFEHFKFFQGNDIAGTYYTLLKHCLNGLPYSRERYDYATISSSTWSEVIDFFDTDSDDNVAQENIYANQSFIDLSLLAKKNKNIAVDIIQYLMHEGKLTDAWLYCFYVDVAENSIRALQSDIWDTNMPQTLKNLKNKVTSVKWPEIAMNGYKDVDAFLPCIQYMHPRLFVMGAAYFIHRVLNRNNVYYDTNVAATATQVIFNLSQQDLDDASTKLYFMMVLSWLSKPYALKSPRKIIFPLLTKIFVSIENKDDLELRALSVKTLYFIAFVFKLRVHLAKEDSKPNRQASITIRTIDNTKVYEGQFDQLTLNFLTTQFDIHKSTTDFARQILPPFEIDGSDLQYNASGDTEDMSTLIANSDCVAGNAAVSPSPRH